MRRGLPKRKTQRRTAVQLFRVIGNSAGCLEFLERLAASDCSDRLWQRLCSLAQRVDCHRADVVTMWSKLTRDSSFLCTILDQIPEDYVEKARDLFDLLYWNSSQANPSVQGHLTLIGKLCRRSMSHGEELGDVLSALLIVDSERMVKFLADCREALGGALTMCAAPGRERGRSWLAPAS